MTKFASGLKSGEPFFKILRNNDDDPLTTPSTDTGKFAFDSEQPGNKIGYIIDIVVVEPDFTSYPVSGGTLLVPTAYYLPGGTDFDNCNITVMSWSDGGDNFQAWYFFQGYFTDEYGLSYFPLCEVRQNIDYVNKNEFQGPRLDLSTGQVSGSGQIYSLSGYISRAMLYQTRQSVEVPVTDSGAPNPVSRSLMTVFNLPMMSGAIPNYAGTSSPGQEVIRVDKEDGGVFRIALPGYAVSNSDPNRFLMHEDKIPAKILAAGEISVSSGGTATITTRFQLPLTTYMDYIVRRDSPDFPTFWHPPFINSISEGQELGFTYVVSDNTIVITSTSDSDMIIRYMVCANAGRNYTTGGKKIQLKGTDVVGEYLQIKRPGSSDLGPTLDDIMVDSRLVYVPLLAEGFLNFNSTDMPNVPNTSNRYKGVRSATIAVPNPNGMLLFPKVGTIYDGDAEPAVGETEPYAIWGEHGVAINVGSDSGKCLGYSTWANLVDDTHVDLFSGGNNPWTFQGGTASYSNQVIGLRYYIFGIPQNL